MQALNNNKIIGFDLDGVIFDHTNTLIKLATQFDWHLEPKETQTEIMSRILPRKIWTQIQYTLYDDPIVSLESPLMHGAKETITKLAKNKIDFFVISRRKSSKNAIDLLIKHKLWPQFFNPANSFFVLTPKDKNIKASELCITHYIDDQIKVLDQLNNVPNKFLFDGQNALSSPPAKYTHITTWQELAGHLF